MKGNNRALCFYHNNANAYNALNIDYETNDREKTP